MNSGLAIIALLVSGWSFGLLTAWWWDDRCDRKIAESEGCGRCARCRPAPDFRTTFPVMIVCATCGNKRCPHATDCRLDCTGSNESGQPGSRFP